MIQTQPADLRKLVDEYAELVQQSDSPNWELIEAKLIDVHEWTPDAAELLVRMARDYGWFVLRNAAALAVACQQEDGELGL